MRKINYIASAGTGKTYTLVEKLVNYYILKENVNINNIFISTFTEKAASELKSRIYEKLKKEIYKHRKNSKTVEKLLDNFHNIQHSYIGTIHSLLLRILRSHPEITKITEETTVLDNTQQEGLFFEVFEQFLEKSSKENLGRIISYIRNKNQIYKIFKDIYLNRWKIDFNDAENIDKYEEKLNSLKKAVTSLLDEFINKYYKNFVNKPDLLKIDFIDIKKKIKNGNFLDIKIKSNKKFPKLLKTDVKSLDEYKKIQNSQEIISEREDQLIQSLTDLKDIALYINYLLILKNFEDFYEILEEKKKENHFISYDDILLKAKELFEENPDILEKYRSKFKVIFIDEFQDTDRLQIDIIKLLSKKSDLVIFGDPKQCIYEWRNANLYNYINFVNEGFTEINLDICHRSNLSLIAFFNLFFKEKNYLNINYSERKPVLLEHLDERFVKPVKYPSYKDPVVIKHPVELIETEKDHEPYVLAGKIKQLLDAGYKPQDILVLFRTRSKTDKYLQELKAAGIPFISYLSSHFYNSSEILTVLNILKLIQYPYNQINVIAVLKSPVFNFSDQDILNMRDRLDISKIPELEPICKLEEMKNSLNISQIIDFIYENIPVLEIFALYPDGKQKVANLKKLAYIAQKLEKENFQLRNFIDFIEENRYSEEDEATVVEDDNFVKIMTMHKSKGLEAKVVIIPNLSEKSNPFNQGFFTVENELMVKIHDENNKEIAKSINFDKDKVKLKNYLEEKRLFYVAFTRAKDKLVLIHSGLKGYMKEIGKVIDEIDGCETEVFIDDGKIVKMKMEILREKYTGIKKKSEYWKRLQTGSEDLIESLMDLEKQEEIRKKEFEKAVSESRFVTVSALIGENNEKRFIEEGQIAETEQNPIEHIDKAVEVGILIHKILEEFSYSSDKKEALKELKDLLNKYISSIKEELREEIFNEVSDKLERFLESDIYREISSSRVIFREMPFTLKDKGRFVEGKIDIVYEKDGKIFIMDYKTGKPSNSEEKYKAQKEYYTKAVQKIFPGKEIIFKLGHLI
ncbi:UvrD-helicase domain-containing protein [Persephonella sp.]